MEDIKLTTNLVNAILQYLSNRPYVEVAGLIDGIQKEASVQTTAPAEPLKE